MFNYSNEEINEKLEEIDIKVTLKYYLKKFDIRTEKVCIRKEIKPKPIKPKEKFDIIKPKEKVCRCLLFIYKKMFDYTYEEINEKLEEIDIKVDVKYYLKKFDIRTNQYTPHIKQTK